MEPLRAIDIIENTVGFDAEWYAATYPDAGLLGMPPHRHYAYFGRLLGRGIQADFGDPMEDAALAAALLRKPRISYCTPIMNRPDDIRGTLAANLEANRPLADQVEFIVVFLDEDRETQGWVRENFPEDLASGYLRMVVETPLDSWHFGRAKNSHRFPARGEIYSSLDGDNFVTLEETRLLLDIHEVHPKGFVFHHFTGTWGDGSSGRISMPIHFYREIGYDESFLPRQYDEMDVLLTVMNAYPMVPLVRIKAENHGFASKRSREFFKEAGIDNPVIEVAAVANRLPLNPKTDGYVEEDASMQAMTTFNQGVCFMKNARTTAARDKYLQLAVHGRHQVVDTVPREKILGTLFRATGYPAPGSLDIGADDVCIFACMKNDENFLRPFYEHHKALGVKYFFIVDDGSKRPISELLPYDDVHVYQPKVGRFLTAKGMWIEGMMKGYLDEGQWALTLDADEFVDLPQGFSSFQELVHSLRMRGQETMAGLLVDMVPKPGTSVDLLIEAETRFLEVFNHHVWIEEPASPGYTQHRPVQWAFGPYSELSWRLDARFHAFGTFDSLRKIPLAQFRKGRHVNQGFHTLHYNDGTSQPGSEIWDVDAVLAIRHFKLIKLFSAESRKRMAAMVAQSNASEYHTRTTENIAKIFGDDSELATQKIMELPCLPASIGVLQGMDPRMYKK
ncbi:glycosyltransferase family 2 protein [Paracoccus sp. TOH]|uniref:glycosyltransferase family 2 protein n=1 Tax=Paracoccus sp. TOH TaxID=1263728 RepID=UPI0025B23A24|nr:glycosyltransferase family 2 protein [Paracoccus sp. TOH]WJS86322.1 glycosyltransferase family 2 protein [Paracoccus sp. TOH]